MQYSKIERTIDTLVFWIQLLGTVGIGLLCLLATGGASNMSDLDIIRSSDWRGPIDTRSRIILHRLPCSYNSCSPYEYVVHHQASDLSCYWGSYFWTLTEAIEAYREKMERHYGGIR